MITDMTLMLYVKDVVASSKFWQALGLNVALQQDLGGDFETVLLMYNETGAAIQLYSRDYIRETQPEMLEKESALVFSADIVDDLYEKVKEVSPLVSELLPYGNQHVFTFQDLDGQTFTLIGEKVDVPNTEENMATFDDNVAQLLPLPLEYIEGLTEPAYIFFGRRTCPWSRHLAQEFPDFAGIRIYFVDTEGTDAENSIRQKYGVETVPTVIKRASNGLYVKFDNSCQKLSDFIK